MPDRFEHPGEDAAPGYSLRFGFGFERRSAKTVQGDRRGNSSVRRRPSRREGHNFRSGRDPVLQLPPGWIPGFAGPKSSHRVPVLSRGPGRNPGDGACLRERSRPSLRSRTRSGNPRSAKPCWFPRWQNPAYKILFSAKDELSGATALAEIAFEVRGHAVERSDSLVVRNFRFYRSGDDDAAPLKLAAYRPGDTVWARFDIIGYKLQANNQRDVAYTLAVSGPGGRVLLAPRQPTVDKGSSFYPMKYLPCVISLTLQPDIRPQEYTITIVAEDRIGNQTHESKQTFRVE